MEGTITDEDLVGINLVVLITLNASGGKNTMNNRME